MKLNNFIQVPVQLFGGEFDGLELTVKFNISTIHCPKPVGEVQFTPMSTTLEEWEEMCIPKFEPHVYAQDAIRPLRYNYSHTE